MSKDLIKTTASFLSKYIVFSKTEIEDISNKLFCYGVDLSQNALKHVEVLGNGLAIDLGNRREIWLNKEESQKGMCLKDWIDLEIELSHSWISSANSQLFLPQSLNYHHIDALDFEKGCYLGQEIIARMHFRKAQKEVASDKCSRSRTQRGSLDKSRERKTLAVLKNTGDQPIEIISQENKVLAQPI